MAENNRVRIPDYLRSRSYLMYPLPLLKLANENYRNKDQLWERVQDELTRLYYSSGRYQQGFKPEQKIDFIKKIENESFAFRIAIRSPKRNINKDGDLTIGRSDAKTARREVTVVLAYVLVNDRVIDKDRAFNFLHPVKEVGRDNDIKLLDRLQQLHRESDRVGRIRAQFKDQLTQQPHLDLILNYWERYSSIQPLLEECGISHTPVKLKEYKNAIQEFLFVDNTEMRLKELRQKVLFAIWSKTGRNLWGEDIDGRFSAAASFLTKTEFSRSTSLVVDVRPVLEAMIRAEFDRRILKDYHFWNDNGMIARSKYDVSPRKTYEVLSGFQKDPSILREIVACILNNVTNPELLAPYFHDVKLSSSTLHGYTSAFRILLENVLLMHPDDPINLSSLGRDRSGEIRELRLKIREFDKKPTS